MLGLDALELDGNLFSGDDVGTEIDITKGTRSDLSANTVFITDTQVLFKVRSVDVSKESKMADDVHTMVVILTGVFGQSPSHGMEWHC